MPNTNNSLHQTKDRLTHSAISLGSSSHMKPRAPASSRKAYVCCWRLQAKSGREENENGRGSARKVYCTTATLIFVYSIINQDPNSTITLIGRTHSYFTLFKVTFAQDHDYFLPVKPFSILRISSSYSSYHTSLQWLKQTQRMQWSEDASTTS